MWISVSSGCFRSPSICFESRSTITISSGVSTSRVTSEGPTSTRSVPGMRMLTCPDEPTIPSLASIRVASAMRSFIRVMSALPCAPAAMPDPLAAPRDPRAFATPGAAATSAAPAPAALLRKFRRSMLSLSPPAIATPPFHIRTLRRIGTAHRHVPSSRCFVLFGPLRPAPVSRLRYIIRSARSHPEAAPGNSYLRPRRYN